ncbi:ABC transporter ATP-binding protein [Parasphingorhabdus sp.]|uniref:ABC transporter ATP-binding protein n=1 Tax=Parasphingorhabdus sp. TaxID=2709688 RepID=UPI003299728D
MIPLNDIISIHDVKFRWSQQASFSLNVPKFNLVAGETALLLGESGSGKSTLLSLICGTVTTASGSVGVCGTQISDLSAGQRDGFRADNIGLIFQQFNLLPYASVLDNILLPLRFAPSRRARVENPKHEAARLCRQLGLPEACQHQKAGRLSVGQQQRVAAARALIGAPPLIIADEPTSSLDAGTQEAFLDLLFAQIQQNGSTLLMVSHDARLAAKFHRVIQMEDVLKRKEFGA